ncbi:MAG: succinate dehydrogenase, cytochrome b556 subunit [Alphaproteobacteria bacterium]|nr:succinate dehydrogenase, cytochrome b556 subunit [Alphaproteobacteria bacterium]
MSTDSGDQKHISQRPLSPHLQVYKLPLAALISIGHRATGFALTCGTLLLLWLLIAAATGPAPYNTFMAFATSPLGQFMLFGWTLSLYFHLTNGVRHLFGDMGYLLKIKSAHQSGCLILIATFLLTAGTWYCALYI